MCGLSAGAVYDLKGDAEVNPIVVDPKNPDELSSDAKSEEEKMWEHLKAIARSA